MSAWTIRPSSSWRLSTSGTSFYVMNPERTKVGVAIAQEHAGTHTELSAGRSACDGLPSPTPGTPSLIAGSPLDPFAGGETSDSLMQTLRSDGPGERGKAR
jgi:hypothetical protein